MSSPPPHTPRSVLTTGSVPSEVTFLFRTKRVSEIRSYEAIIRQQAHQKSNALRHLLGTRYKDILNAADTITQMRHSSVTHIRDALRPIQQSATTFKHQFPQNTNPTSPQPVSDDLERRRTLHVLSSKLKHIVDSTEVLYAHLESGHIYEAAVRYSFASRNYHQIITTTCLEGVANRFAELTWAQVKVFRTQILDAAEKNLQLAGKPSRDYSRLFVSLMLLTDSCPVISILDGMLAGRTGLIWNEQPSAQREDVASQMRRIATVVRDTISCVADMFWADSGVASQLRGVDDHAIETVSHLKSTGALKDCCTAWTQSVKGWLEERGSSVLAGAVTSRMLADTLRAIDDVFDRQSWQHDCQCALQEHPSFVFDIFKPFIRDRAGVVARESIEGAVSKVIEDIESVWSEIDISPHVGRRIWASVSGQSVQCTIKGDESGSSKDVISHEDTIAIAQTLSSNGGVSDVLGTFEESLREAITDGQVLTSRIPLVTEDFEKSVRSYLPTILCDLKQRLSNISTPADDNNRKEENSHEQALGRALFIARSATAFEKAEIVKSVYCFSGSQSSNTDKLEALHAFQQNALDLSSAAYGVWARLLTQELKGKLSVELSAAEFMMRGNVSTQPKNASQRDEVAKKEEKQLPHSTMASTPLINFLLAVSSSANRAGGFALPPEASSHLRREIIAAATSAYGDALHLGKSSKEMVSSFTDDTNPAIMQLLFDIRLLQEFFTPQKSSDQPQSKLFSELDELQSLASSMIVCDDAEAFDSLLRESVISYASRTSILFGAVAISRWGDAVYNKDNHSSASSTGGNGVFMLARTVPRFTYLPAPMPSTYSSGMRGPVGLSTKSALGLMRSQVSAANASAYRKRDPETSVAEYASKVTESVGRLGRDFFESFARKVT